MTTESSTSHRQDIVAQIVHNDPDAAELLFELLVLTDTSTPHGAAAHADTLKSLFILTPDFSEAFREKENRMREVASLEYSLA